MRVKSTVKKTAITQSQHSNAIQFFLVWESLPQIAFQHNARLCHKHKFYLNVEECQLDQIVWMDQFGRSTYFGNFLICKIIFFSTLQIFNHMQANIGLAF